jgi:ribonuclease E
VATFLNNKKRRELAKLEDEGSVVIQILGRENISPEHLVFECLDSNGREVKFPL